MLWDDSNKGTVNKLTIKNENAADKLLTLNVNKWKIYEPDFFLFFGRSFPLSLSLTVSLGSRSLATHFFPRHFFVVGRLIGR